MFLITLTAIDTLEYPTDSLEVSGNLDLLRISNDQMIFLEHPRIFVGYPEYFDALILLLTGFFGITDYESKVNLKKFKIQDNFLLDTLFLIVEI